jgi:hypothetical protein
VQENPRLSLVFSRQSRVRVLLPLMDKGVTCTVPTIIAALLASVATPSCDRFHATGDSGGGGRCHGEKHRRGAKTAGAYNPLVVPLRKKLITARLWDEF